MKHVRSALAMTTVAACSAGSPGPEAALHSAAAVAVRDAGGQDGLSMWTDGTRCTSESSIQRWAYDGSTTIFRQSICTHYEAPFFVLLVGEARALLVDTGTGDVDVRAAVDVALEGKDVDLVVAHSHAHGDHVGGDRAFVGRPRTTVVGHSPRAVANQFGIRSDFGSIDLGDRTVDVIATPGHEASHVAFYDRATGLLLTGDTLYPGRLYVRDWTAYRASIARLVGFVDAGHPATHIIGAHVELSATGEEYPMGAVAHPDEHSLALGESDLRDLLKTLNALGDHPTRTPGTNYVVVPLP